MADKKLSTKIRVKDTVQIIGGKEAGKRGRVLKVHPLEGKVVVEKRNMIFKHQRPTNQQKHGGILEVEGPIHSSNVMVVCPKCDLPSRIRIQILEDGRKLRLCARCSEVLDRE